MVTKYHNYKIIGLLACNMSERNINFYGIYNKIVLIYLFLYKK